MTTKDEKARLAEFYNHLVDARIAQEGYDGVRLAERFLEGAVRPKGRDSLPSDEDHEVIESLTEGLVMAYSRGC